MHFRCLLFVQSRLYPNFGPTKSLLALKCDLHNPGSGRPIPDVCRILCSNVKGRARNCMVTWPWLCICTNYSCALKLCSQICVTCGRCCLLDLAALSCAGCHMPEVWLHTWKMDMELFTNPNLNVTVVKCWYLEFMVWDETSMCLVFTMALT